MFYKEWFRRFLSATLFLTLIGSVFSCREIKDVVPESPGPNKYHPYVLTLAILGSEGSFTNYSYYTIPFKDVMHGTLDAVHRGIENTGYYDYEKVGDIIYGMADLTNTTLEGIRINRDTRMTESFGKVNFGQTITDFKKADDQTVVSVSVRFGFRTITFRKFNINTTKATHEKVILADTKFGPMSEKEGIDYSGMAISGKHLFLSYYITNPETYATRYTDTARIAVFSYPDLEFEKIIKDTRVGPIGGFEVRSGLIKDEAGNVFAISHSNPANGFMFEEGKKPKPAGILKINRGETNFDPDYFFKIEEEGGNAAHVQYLGDGKAFAEINTASRDDQEYLKDNPLRSAVLDLKSQKVHFISGVPEHHGEGRRLPLLQEGQMVYLCVPEKGDLYVYKMDTKHFTATRGAKVKANFVAGFFKL